MVKRLSFAHEDGGIDDYEIVERWEQLQLGLTRLALPIYTCMPDDLPGQQRFMRIVNLIDTLDEAIKAEINLIHGERISPDAPMISRKDGK